MERQGALEGVGSTMQQPTHRPTVPPPVSCLKLSERIAYPPSTKQASNQAIKQSSRQRQLDPANLVDLGVALSALLSANGSTELIYVIRPNKSMSRVISKCWFNTTWPCSLTEAGVATPPSNQLERSLHAKIQSRQNVAGDGYKTKTRRGIVPFRPQQT